MREHFYTASGVMVFIACTTLFGSKGPRNRREQPDIGKILSAQPSAFLRSRRGFGNITLTPPFSPFPRNASTPMNRGTETAHWCEVKEV